MSVLQRINVSYSNSASWTGHTPHPIWTSSQETSYSALHHRLGFSSLFNVYTHIQWTGLLSTLFVLSLYCPLLLLFPTITSHTFIIIAVQFPLSCSHLFNCWIIAITLGFLLYIPHIAIHKSFTPSEPFSSYHIIQNLGYYRYCNSIYHIPFFLVPRRHYLPLAIAGHSVDYQKSFLYIRSQGLSLHCTLLAHI